MPLFYTSIVIAVVVFLCIVHHGLKVVRTRELGEQDLQNKTAEEKKEETVEVSEDALGALMKLGYKKKESTEALKKAMRATKSSDDGILVRAALKHL